MIGVLRNGTPDGILIAAAVAVVTFGALMVPSAAVALGDGLLMRHWAYLGVGGAVFAVVLLIPSVFWQRTYGLAIVAAILLCALALLLGREVKGSQRWIDLGIASVQGSEFAKVLVLLFIAGFLARFEHRGAELRHELWIPLLLLVSLFVLLLMAPDFGTVVVLTLLSAALLFLAGVRLRIFLSVVVVAAVLFALLVMFQPERLARVTSFVNPWADAFGDGYQLTQSLIAFGRGGYLGQGLGESVQKLHYLPEAHNDFIFAVIVEELGLIGGLLLIVLFAVLVLRLLAIGRRAALQEHWHGSYLAYGAAILLGAQFLINLGVNSGALPTKGLTLPFVSYGGNSLMVCAMLLALGFRVQLECERPARETRGRARRRTRSVAPSKGSQRRGR